MKKLTGPDRNPIGVILLLLFIIACNTKKNIPFPEDGPGSMQPVAKPLTFSEPQPLQWKDISPDSIKPAKSIPIDLDKLPAVPFTINDFKPLKNPIRPIKLDWDNIPDSAINFDTVTERPFRLKKSILPKPIITKAGIPKLMPNTTSGILQFAEEEGLPGLKVSASLVDKNGMIWLATSNGLCRYTGDYIYSYHFLNKTPQGSEHTIMHMAEDPEGRIWASTSGDGVYVLDIDNGLVLHDQSKLFGASIICDHTGNIWLACFNDGLYLINPEKGTIKNTFSNQERKAENSVYSIAEDRYHNIWTGNPDGISIIDSSRKKIKRLTKNEGLNVSFVFEFFEDSQGYMWIGNLTRGINFISLKNNTLSKIDTYNGFNGGGVEYTEDRQGQIWIARKDTFYVLNKQRTAIKNIVTNVLMVDTYKGTSFTDPQGNIWVGTMDKGVVIIDPQGPLPEHLDTKNGLTDNNVWGILEDKDKNIWIGTLNGINIYDPQKDQLRILGTGQGLGNNRIRRIMEFDGDEILATTSTGFSIINRRKKSLTNYGKEQGLSDYGLTKALKDGSNRIWLNAFEGILICDIAKNTQQLMDRSTGLLSNLIWDMVTDRQGNIWAGSDSGICVINLVTNSIKYLRESEGLCNNVVQKMLVRDNGEIWIATQKGISVVDAYKNTITNLTANEGLVPEIIFDLLEQNNKMYAGSVDGLIVITLPDTSDNAVKKNTKWSFINYGKRQGFPFNDYNQNTGTATTSGQTWWGITPVLTVATQPAATDTLVPRVYITSINIMDEAPFFTLALSKQLHAGDTLWYDSGKKYYLKNTLPKDSGYFSNKKISWDSLSLPFQLPDGLVMPYDQNSLHFSFTNNDIKGRDKIVYRYILEGTDKKWSDASDKTTTKNYYNLSPGNYTFKVCTRSFNGLWSNPDELSFTIRPPWWQTWWAYLLYIAVFSGLIWLIVQYRSRWLQKENRVLEEKVVHRTAQLHKSIEELKATQSQLIQSEKMASLGELTAGIAHEIQNPLNFVNNFSEVNKELLVEMKDEMDKGNLEDAKALANDIIDNEEKINHHGKRADAIVKGMLQHSRSSSGAKEPTDINALADEYLRLAYHGLRAKDKSFNATMKTDFDETIGNINIIPQDMGRVILNLITNAFYVVAEKKKQRPEGYEPTVSVSTKKLNGKVEVRVKDNGSGIPQKVLDKIFQPFFTTKPTGQGTGLGLSMSYDIVTKGHGGELKVETKEGEGSQFIIILPA